MQSKNCGSCRYFRQHYVKTGVNRFSPILRGHCVFPKLKDRSLIAPACKQWKAQE